MKKKTNIAAIIVIMAIIPILFLLALFLALEHDLRSGEKFCDEVEVEFQSYERDPHIMQVCYDRYFVFNGHELDLGTLVKDTDLRHDWEIVGHKIYFSTGSKNGLFSLDICRIYECDFYGNDLQIVYESEEFIRVSEWLNVEERPSRYNYSHDAERMQLTIYDQTTGETAIIDMHTFNFNNSEIQDILDKYSVKYARTDISEDHIFVSFCITGYFFSPHVTFELDFDSKKMHFATLCTDIADPLDYTVVYIE